MCDRRAVQLVRDKFPQAAKRPNQGGAQLMKLARQLGLKETAISGQLLHENWNTEGGSKERGTSSVHLYRCAVGTREQRLRVLEAIGMASRVHGTGHLFGLFAQAVVPHLYESALVLRESLKNTSLKNPAFWAKTHRNGAQCGKHDVVRCEALRTENVRLRMLATRSKKAQEYMTRAIRMLNRTEVPA